MSPVRPIYDQIGADYISRRRTDPTIFALIVSALEDCASVINIGAGAGSYEPPNCILAVEPSTRMIAQRPEGAAECIQAFAEDLPLPDRSYDGALACLTIHHWSDIPKGLEEMCRVARKRVVLFTWDPEFESDFWLTRDYFPAILELDRPRFPSMTNLENILGKIEVRTVPIPAHCEDGFIGAYWKRPEAFLDPEVWRTNSAMARLDSEILENGIAHLRDDLESDRWLSRNSKLRELDSLDIGYRLVISERKV